MRALKHSQCRVRNKIFKWEVANEAVSDVGKVLKIRTEVNTAYVGLNSYSAFLSMNNF